MTEGRERSPQPTPPPADERLAGIVRRTLAESPPRARWSVAFLIAVTAATIAFQLLSEDDGGAVSLEALAVALGTGGAMLIGIAFALHGASQNLASCRGRELRFEAGRLHQMLLALPTLGLAACVMLGASTGIILARAVQKESPVLLAGALLYLGLILFSSRTVTRTTRYLYQQAREQAAAAAAARVEASEAQLAALQAQMNPHFLFNALNTVASLVRTDAVAAERTVENLAGVLRRTLDRSSQPLRSLGDEIDYLRAYLAVEEERWGDRLRVVWEVDPPSRGLLLPPMTLQPLVENALHHGLGECLEGGTLVVSAARHGDELRLSVRDDGAGLPTAVREGTGLGNLRQRLATLYGDRARLQIEGGPGGTRVAVVLPAEPTPAANIARS